jgi:hypothetical protein
VFNLTVVHAQQRSHGPVTPLDDTVRADNGNAFDEGIEGSLPLLRGQLGLRFSAMKTNERFDSCNQDHRIGRLNQVRICTALQSKELAFVAEKCGRQLKNWNVPGLRVTFDAAANFISENIRQLHIQNDDRR